MRKLAVSSAAIAVMLVFAAVAYAANRYEVTPAATNPAGKGSPAKPKPKTVKFGFTAEDESGARATPVIRYSIRFQGLRYFGGRSQFPKCTFAQANGDATVNTRCKRALVGRGTVRNRFGPTSDPNNPGRCFLSLRLYNTGRGFALRLDGGPNNNPDRSCPTTVSQAIDARFRTVRIGGRPSVALNFNLEGSNRNLADPLLDGSLQNSVSEVSSTINRKTRTVRIKGKRRKVSVLSSIACAGRQRAIQVDFTDDAGDRVRANKSVRC